VTAGLDQLAGGSWMGLNDSGVTACMLNRTGHLGPAPGKRSRGELVLEALDHVDAVDAATALSQLEPGAYRPFNMIVADNRDAYWLRHAGPGGSGGVEVIEVPEGVSMLTAAELNDPSVPRIARYRPRFEAAGAPKPDTGDWSDWTDLISEASEPGDPEPNRAMTMVTDTGYGTVSASLLALPAPDVGQPAWLLAAGLPGKTPFEPIPGLD